MMLLDDRHRDELSLAEEMLDEARKSVDSSWLQVWCCSHNVRVGWNDDGEDEEIHHFKLSLGRGKLMPMHSWNSGQTAEGYGSFDKALAQVKMQLTEILAKVAKARGEAEKLQAACVPGRRLMLRGERWELRVAVAGKRPGGCPEGCGAMIPWGEEHQHMYGHLACTVQAGETVTCLSYTPSYIMAELGNGTPVWVPTWWFRPSRLRLDDSGVLGSEHAAWCHDGRS